jgi:hypothetical protein
VDASAFLDDLTNLVEAVVRRIVRFASATRHKSRPENCENGGIEESLRRQADARVSLRR